MATKRSEAGGGGGSDPTRLGFRGQGRTRWPRTTRGARGARQSYRIAAWFESACCDRAVILASRWSASPRCSTSSASTRTATPTSTTRPASNRCALAAQLFFVSFDPGGLVSIDKPPLGLWLQALTPRSSASHRFAADPRGRLRGPCGGADVLHHRPRLGEDRGSAGRARAGGVSVVRRRFARQRARPAAAPADARRLRAGADAIESGRTRTLC